MPERIAAIDWVRANRELLDQGFTVVPPVLTVAECRELAGHFRDDRVGGPIKDLAELGFGLGQYRYLKHPFPSTIRTLQTAFYERIAATANEWSRRLRYGVAYPRHLRTFHADRRRAGHPRSRPAILRYPKGGHNNLHQDLVDDHLFPYQVIFGLSKQGADYTGGHLVLVEQRRGQQGVPHVVTIPRGGAVILASALHARRGPRGFHRSVFRHAVSTVEDGVRCTLGIVFHNFVE